MTKCGKIRDFWNFFTFWEYHIFFIGKLHRSVENDRKLSKKRLLLWKIDFFDSLYSNFRILGNSRKFFSDSRELKFSGKSSALVSSPFLLCVVFNGAKRTLHQEPRDGIFWLASNLGLVFINFGDFYSSGLPTCQFPCLTFWQNCHMIILKNSTHSKWLIFQSSNWFWHFQF